MIETQKRWIEYLVVSIPAIWVQTPPRSIVLSIFSWSINKRPTDPVQGWFFSLSLKWLNLSYLCNIDWIWELPYCPRNSFTQTTACPSLRLTEKPLWKLYLLHCRKHYKKDINLHLSFQVFFQTTLTNVSLLFCKTAP